MRYDDLCDPEQAFIGRRTPPRGEVWEPEPKPCGFCEHEPCECVICAWCRDSDEDLREIEGDMVCAACRAEYGRP